MTGLASNTYINNNNVFIDPYDEIVAAAHTIMGFSVLYACLHELIDK